MAKDNRHFIILLIVVLTIVLNCEAVDNKRMVRKIECKWSGCTEAVPEPSEGTDDVFCIEYESPCSEPENSKEYFRCCKKKPSEGRQRSFSNLTRIINGLQAYPGQFPYQVSIYFDNGKGERYFVGSGAIYSPDYIITTAYPFAFVGIDFPVDMIRIVAGDYTIYETDNGEQERSVMDIIHHESFNDDGRFSNNVALLKLKTPLKFSEMVKSIKIASEDQMSQGMGTASGWTYFPQIEKVTMGFTDGAIVLVEVCKHYLEYEGLNASSVICFEADENTGFNFYEDLGTPLTCKNHKNENEFCGILSFGHGSYGVYSKIYEYISWIKKMTM